MPGLSALSQPEKGALPPAFGSPRGISAKMKILAAIRLHLCENTPGVRAKPEGAAPPATLARGTGA